MTWTATEKPVVTKAEIEDNLDLGEGSRVHITYGPYQYCSFAVYADYAWRDANLNASDRDGTRAAVLRHLLPRVQAALEALRDAVAETLDNGDPRLPPRQVVDASTGEACGAYHKTDSGSFMCLLPDGHDGPHEAPGLTWMRGLPDEFPADDWSEPTNGTRDPQMGETRKPEPLDMVGFANGLLGGK